MRTPAQIAMDAAKDGAEQVARRLRHAHTRDGDWDPIFVGVDDSGRVIVAGIDPRFMASAEAKDRLGDHVLPGLVREKKLRGTALLLSTWWVDSDDVARERGIPRDAARDVLTGYRRRGGRLVDHPQASERLTICAASAQQTWLEWARIGRGENGPTLSAWDRGPDAQIDGRMIDKVRMALQARPGLRQPHPSDI